MPEKSFSDGIEGKIENVLIYKSDLVIIIY